MAHERYADLIAEIPMGKRLKNAIYIHLDSLAKCSNELQDLVNELQRNVVELCKFNVLKFYCLEYKVSFLSYPEFFEKPHPELRSSVIINLTTGKIRKHDYQNSDNPPILHRKEVLLDPTHPEVEKFESLTRAEEAEGLYRDKRVIGFKRNWESLLERKRLEYSGHKLVRLSKPNAQKEESPEVHRHKTAIVRYKFSRPVQTLIEHGLIAENISLLDYGCGQGDDVKGLQEMGFAATAWDPVYFPDGAKEPADIVNLGFVLNVIEDPIERVKVLHEAYELSRKLLVVSTLIATSSTATLGRPYRDGILTSRNTFQKYFRQEELERYIEDVLDTSTVAVGLGIFYVFRSPADHQQFLSNRSKRTINWIEISRKVRPVRQERPGSQRPDLYEINKELLDAFWSKMLELGRIPTKEEFEGYDELRTAVGSTNKAKSLFLRRFGEETLAKAFEQRRNDLQVYLALSNFRKKVPFKHLPDNLRTDIRTFLGGYKQAVEASENLLFSAGNPDVITHLCDETPFGYLDQQALYVHKNLVQDLHPVLRIYVGCAQVLYGDLQEVDVIKIHKQSGKVSLLKYEDFETKPLPELQERIKVNLRQQAIEVFDYRSVERQELLYFKERYVTKDHPEQAKWEEFSRWLQSFGLDLESGYGPSKQELLSFLGSRGVTIDFEEQGSSEQVSEPE